MLTYILFSWKSTFKNENFGKKVQFGLFFCEVMGISKKFNVVFQKFISSSKNWKYDGNKAQNVIILGTKRKKSENRCIKKIHLVYGILWLL